MCYTPLDGLTLSTSRASPSTLPLGGLVATLPEVLAKIVNLIPWPNEVNPVEKEKLLADIATLGGDLVDDVIAAISAGKK